MGLVEQAIEISMKPVLYVKYSCASSCRGFEHPMRDGDSDANTFHTCSTWFSFIPEDKLMQTLFVACWAAFGGNKQQSDKWVETALSLWSCHSLAPLGGLEFSRSALQPCNPQSHKINHASRLRKPWENHKDLRQIQAKSEGTWIRDITCRTLGIAAGISAHPW